MSSTHQFHGTFSIFLSVTLNRNILFIETLDLRLILAGGKIFLIHCLNQPLAYWEEHRYFTDWIILGANPLNTLKHAVCFISGPQPPLFCNDVEGKEGNRALMSREDWIVQSFEWLWYFAVWLTGEKGEEGHTTATHVFYIYILLF